MKKECGNCIYYINGPYSDYCDILNCSTHDYDWCFRFVEKEFPDLLHEDLKKLKYNNRRKIMDITKFDELNDMKEEYERLQEAVDILDNKEAGEIVIYGETLFTEEEVAQYNLEKELDIFKNNIKTRILSQMHKIRKEMSNKIKEIEDVIKVKEV